MRTRDVAEFDWSFPMVLVWAKYLTVKRTTWREFEIAEVRSMDLDWMPDNAKDFLKLARGENINPYPDVDKAFYTACQNCGMRGIENRNWLHPIVYETATRIGFNRLAGATEGFIGQFERVYNQIISEFENGKSFVVPESHQIEHKHIPADQKVAKAKAEKMRAMFGGRKAVVA